MTKTENLVKIYTECSNGYHKVDDFRAKLLGFLPLASGIGIFGALFIQSDRPYVLSINFMAIGIFGVLITLGLLIFELKGILKCTQFIFLGSWIESQMSEDSEGSIGKGQLKESVPGYFTELSQRRGIMSNVVTEPVASAIIYSTVLAAWSYVICIMSDYLKIIIPIIIFSVFSISMYTYWRVIFKRIKKSFENRHAFDSSK